MENTERGCRAWATTSPRGANYEEARGAESPADFIDETRTALKEVRETRYCLKLILRAELIGRPNRLNELIDEAGELITILTGCANTARRRTERRES